MFFLVFFLYFITSLFLLQPLMRALDDMENANAQVEVAVEEVTKARTQKIKVVHLLAVTMLLEVLYLTEYWNHYALDFPA
jgi:t-SNARE complex subunit (syntaxin)